MMANQDLSYIERHFQHKQKLLANLADAEEFNMVYELIAEVRRLNGSEEPEEMVFSFNCKECGAPVTIKPMPIRPVDLCICCEIGF